MGAQHTPGPWAWSGPNQLWGGEREMTEVLKAADDGASWGMHPPLIEHHWDEGTALANRRLIAAAPDLLAALQAVVAGLADGDEEGLIEHAEQMQAARAAIAKATGTAP